MPSQGKSTHRQMYANATRADAEKAMTNALP
jgi:hypothetical protein